MLNGSTETAGIDPGSNRLQQTVGAQISNYSYDAAGNLIGDGTFSYGYNAEGRRISATATGQTVSYGYNALGQRISKTVNGVSTRYVYDERGHLSGEYDASGQLIQEIVWLGNLPIAALRPGATTPDIYYIHADHLGTPRQITRPSDNKVLWAWESEPFGASLPNQNPSGLGPFVFNLRFPGQYYDQETGLFYNYFRDYDPATGRYVESDPIGLRGGINTYTYVSNNPLKYIDPLGLAIGDFPPAPPGYNLNTWTTGQWDNGKWNLTDPEGKTYTIHPEDNGHWRHWDIQDSNGNDDGSWPPNSKKPWPGQKKPKSNQCPNDPSGDATPWEPPVLNPKNSGSNNSNVPFVPLPEWVPLMSPFPATMPIPVFP